MTYDNDFNLAEPGLDISTTLASISAAKPASIAAIDHHPAAEGDCLFRITEQHCRRRQFGLRRSEVLKKTVNGLEIIFMPPDLRLLKLRRRRPWTEAKPCGELQQALAQVLHAIEVAEAFLHQHQLPEDLAYGLHGIADDLRRADFSRLKNLWVIFASGAWDVLELNTPQSVSEQVGPIGDTVFNAVERLRVELDCAPWNLRYLE